MVLILFSIFTSLSKMDMSMDIKINKTNGNAPPAIVVSGLALHRPLLRPIHEYFTSYKFVIENGKPKIRYRYINNSNLQVLLYFKKEDDVRKAMKQNQLLLDSTLVTLSVEQQSNDQNQENSLKLFNEKVFLSKINNSNTITEYNGTSSLFSMNPYLCIDEIANIQSHPNINT